MRKKRGRSDHKTKSDEPWETGRGAPRKGNPRFKSVKMKCKSPTGRKKIIKKVYKLRR